MGIEGLNRRRKKRTSIETNIRVALEKSFLEVGEVLTYPPPPHPLQGPSPLTWEAEKKQSWGQPHGPASGFLSLLTYKLGSTPRCQLTLKALGTGRLVPSACPDRL